MLQVSTPRAAVDPSGDPAGPIYGVAGWTWAESINDLRHQLAIAGRTDLLSQRRLGLRRGRVGLRGSPAGGAGTSSATCASQLMAWLGPGQGEPLELAQIDIGLASLHLNGLTREFVKA